METQTSITRYFFGLIPHASVLTRVAHRRSDPQEMLDELDHHVRIGGSVPHQLRSNLQHVLVEERHPGGAIGLLQVATGRQRCAVVKHHGELHVRDGIIDAVGLAENDLEVLPLHRHQSAVKAEIEDCISSGGFLLAQQIVRGIDPIKRMVGGNALRFPDQSSERRQPVYGGEQFLALPSGRDMSRPAHHGRDAVTAFWNIQPDVSSAMTSATPTASVGYRQAREVWRDIRETLPKGQHLHSSFASRAVDLGQLHQEVLEDTTWGGSTQCSSGKAGIQVQFFALG